MKVEDRQGLTDPLGVQRSSPSSFCIWSTSMMALEEVIHIQQGFIKGLAFLTRFATWQKMAEAQNNQDVTCESPGLSWLGPRGDRITSFLSPKDLTSSTSSSFNARPGQKQSSCRAMVSSIQATQPSSTVPQNTSGSSRVRGFPTTGDVEATSSDALGHREALPWARSRRKKHQKGGVCSRDIYIYMGL